MRERQVALRCKLLEQLASRARLRSADLKRPQAQIPWDMSDARGSLGQDGGDSEEYQTVDGFGLNTIFPSALGRFLLKFASGPGL